MSQDSLAVSVWVTIALAIILAIVDFLVLGPRTTKVREDEILYLSKKSRGIHVGPCRVWYRYGSNLTRTSKDSYSDSFYDDGLGLDVEDLWEGKNFGFIALADKNPEWQNTLREELTNAIHKAASAYGFRTKTVEDLVTIGKAAKEIVNKTHKFVKLTRLTLTTTISSDMPSLVRSSTTVESEEVIGEQKS